MPLFVKKPVKSTKLMIFLLVILAVLVGSYLISIKTHSERKMSDYRIVDISFVNQPQAKVSAWLADTPSKQMQGLSGIEGLNDNQGMLFSFGEASERAFWMKGMEIPIDIIWMREDIVVKINSDVQPEPGKTDRELTQYSSGQAVDSVLEVRAGWARDRSLRVGNVMSYALD